MQPAEATFQDSGFICVKNLLHLKQISMAEDSNPAVLHCFDELENNTVEGDLSSSNGSLNTPKYLLVAFSGAPYPHSSTQCSCFMFRSPFFLQGKKWRPKICWIKWCLFLEKSSITRGKFSLGLLNLDSKI